MYNPLSAARRTGTALKVALLLGAATFLFLHFSTDFVQHLRYWFGLPPLTDNANSALARYMAGPGAWAFLVGLGYLLCGRLARRAGGSRLYHGFLPGLFGAATVQGLIWLVYPPLSPGELALYLTAGGLGGWLGGWSGQIAYAKGEAIRRARAGILQAAVAQDPHAVAATVARNLHPDRLLFVGVWTVARSDSAGKALDAFEPWASCYSSPSEEPDFSQQALALGHLPQREHLLEGLPVVLNADQLSLEQGRTWLPCDAREVLCVPLFARGTHFVGLLTVALSRPSAHRLLSRFFSRRATSIPGDFCAVAPQVALAVDYHQLIGAQMDRVKRHMHDTSVQHLGSVIQSINATLARRSFADEGGTSIFDDSDVFYLHQARQQAIEAHRTLRQLVYEPQPQITRQPLPERLSELLSCWSRQSGVITTIKVLGTPRPVRAEAEDVFVRVGREALTNVAKHARARRVELGLVYTPSSVTLTITDDGTGFEPSKLPATDVSTGGFGLASIREDAARVGSDLKVQSKPDGGTKLWMCLASSASRKFPSREIRS